MSGLGYFRPNEHSYHTWPYQSHTIPFPLPPRLNVPPDWADWIALGAQTAAECPRISQATRPHTPAGIVTSIKCAAARRWQHQSSIPPSVFSAPRPEYSKKIALMNLRITSRILVYPLQPVVRGLALVYMDFPDLAELRVKAASEICLARRS